nr:CPBP family intramembrane glutamic endopeptidase [Sphingomonas abaci]
MPRDRHELPWGLAVAIVAGTTEEPFFRLLLPLLITLATGNAWAGFGLATLIFGAMHRYQGWRGMVATTLLGAVMAWVYLESGALWLVVLLHMLVDLNGLVIWPALRIQSTPSAASPSGR